jgi:hypothetical protein
VSSLEEEHVWLNPPFHMLHTLIQHYLNVKQKSPHSTSACVLVPDDDSYKHASWRPLLQGMKKLMVFQQGFPLYTNKDKIPCKGVHCQMAVYYDKPHPAMSMKATFYPPPPPLEPEKDTLSQWWTRTRALGSADLEAREQARRDKEAADERDRQQRLAAADARAEPMWMKATLEHSAQAMRFLCTIGGAVGVALMDSGASHTFINKKFVEKKCIHTTPTRRPVELADGNTVLVSGQCTIYVRLKSKHRSAVYMRKVECMVMDLGDENDIVLGQDWLDREQAILDFGARTCTLAKKGLIVECMKRPTSTTHRLTISVIQAQKQIQQGARFFWVHVRDTEVAMNGDSEEEFGPGDAPPSPSARDADDFATAELPAHVSKETRELLQEYTDVFVKPKGLPPDRGITHVIPEVEGSQPVYTHPHRASPKELLEMHKQIKELLHDGLIEPSNSPYGSPVLFVPKPNGTLRMCIDTRKLNAQTVPIRCPIPRVDMLFGMLQGSKFFTALDLQSGYHQILINPEDVPKTAFVTPSMGSFQFKVLSFGFRNAPSIFQAVMNKILAPLLYRGVLVYLDDILIHAKTKVEHDSLLRQVLQILREQKFYVRFAKCDWERSSLKYLGHIVSGDNIKVDPGKTRVVQEWRVPASVRDVRSFLGLANYFRNFIQGYASLSSPMTALTKKEIKWGANTWTQQCQDAFEGIKHALTHAPCLVLPDLSKGGYELIADASLTGIGAVLLQEGHPIAYESRRLTDAQYKWTTTEQEMWAVVHALRVWRCYLEGAQFTVITDHNPLIYLKTQKNLSRKQARWSEDMQQFTFEWKYSPGRTNVADPLSRATQNGPALNAGTVCLLAMTLRPRSTLKRPAQRDMGEQRVAKKAKSVKGRSPQQDGGRTVRDAPQNESSGPTPTQFQPPSEQDVTLHEEEIKDLLSKGCTEDPWFAVDSNTKNLTTHDGLWFMGERIVVPDVPGLRTDIIAELHNSPLCAHVGIVKTAELVQRCYWWPAWRADVTRFVQACDSCQRNKKTAQSPSGELHPLPIPDRKGGSISMDFVVGLPESSLPDFATKGYDAVLVLVDRLTKYVWLVPTYTTVTAEGTAQLFKDTVIQQMGVPDSVITDRGPQFVCKFSTGFSKLLGYKGGASTAFHPQTDGQTERTNAVLGDMLRHFVGHETHNDWHKHLSSCAFAMNNSWHTSTGTTPFRLVMGQDPKLPLAVALHKQHQIPSAFQVAQRMQEGLQEATRCLQQAQQRQKAYYDAGRRFLEFQKGENVLLSTKNLKLKRAGATQTTAKLMPKWLGPFKVSHVVGKGAYRLELPASLSGIHNVFHVSLLKKYKTRDEGGQVQPPPSPLFVQDGQEFFEIEKILLHRINTSGKKIFREYYVLWKGFDVENNSWEPESSVSETVAFQEYWSDKPAPPSLQEERTAWKARQDAKRKS